jgi:hypothetical protein
LTTISCAALGFEVLKKLLRGDELLPTHGLWNQAG